MIPAFLGRWDIAAVRAGHPIEAVVAASGVELTPRGRGFMGCCPFHDDATASLSVGGVPGRFHCFGCDAGGDVIDYVQRLAGLSFVDAIHALDAGTALPWTSPAVEPTPLPRVTSAAQTSRAHPMTTTPERAHVINRLAWQFFTTPAAVTTAEAYLREARGINVAPLRAVSGAEPIVGHAGRNWGALVRHLRGQSVTDAELLDLNLAQPSRNGELIDTYRGRLIIPVLSANGDVDGFLGRDTTGDPKAPKYRNPTSTPTFDKSTCMYQPTHHELDRDANVVIVEGALDALAIAASAAAHGESSMFAPCTTSGVTVSGVQAHKVLALHPKPPVIALDGDPAGRAGTDRWLRALCLDRRRPALVTRLPDRVDPAEWLHQRGVPGLHVFDRRAWSAADGAPFRPELPGRALVRICLDQPGRPVRQVPDVLAALVLHLRGPAARDLVEQAELEMTVRGWNRRGAFAYALQTAISHTRSQAAGHGEITRSSTAVPAEFSTESPVPDAPQVA